MSLSKIFVLVVGLAAFGLAVNGSAEESGIHKLRQDLEHDPETLIVRFKSDRGKVALLLHPEIAEKFFHESQQAQTTIRFTASSPRRTGSGYEVTFQWSITRLGIVEPKKKQVVKFPFGKVTKVRLFGKRDIEGAYGSKDTEL